MAKAIESGMPKLRIEESAARKQARIDRGEDVIVGVNKYQLEDEEEVETLAIDNAAVRTAQINRLGEIRKHRDDAKVQAALAALTHAAESGEGNLLELAVEATRLRASGGEISYALESAFGRYNAETKTVTGVYGSAYSEDAQWLQLQADVQAFADEHGRLPSMLVSKMGQDGHDRGAKVIASAFGDVGFEIALTPMFSTPQEVAQQALEANVHVVGVSSQAAGHTTLVPELIVELRRAGAHHVQVVVGGVIPKKDYDFLMQTGVKAVFGPGTRIPDAAREVLDQIVDGVRRGKA